MIERLLALDDAASRQQLIAQNPSLDWDQLVSTLTERVRQQVHVSAAKARDLADVAIEVAETAGSPTALAKSLRAKANALYSLDEHSHAIEIHQPHAKLFEAARQPLELARTL